MRERLIRMVIKDNAPGCGCLGCLGAIVFLILTLTTSLSVPDIVPGYPMISTFLVLVGIFLAGILVDNLWAFVTGSHLLELQGNDVRLKKGSTTVWEYQLPASSGMRVWHMIWEDEETADGEKEDRDMVLLVIEVRSGLGHPILFWHHAMNLSNWAQREFPLWEGAKPMTMPPPYDMDLGLASNGPSALEIITNHEGEKMIRALMNRAGVTLPSE